MTHEEMVESFEAWYSEEYSHSIKRGARGRAGRHLDKYQGEYISDLTANDFKVWVAAMKRVNK